MVTEGDRRRGVTVLRDGRAMVHMFPPGPVVRSVCGHIFQPRPGSLAVPGPRDAGCKQCAKYARKPACTVCWYPVKVRADGTARSHHSSSPIPCEGTARPVYMRPTWAEARP